jgi:hypothetical protein
VSNFARQRLAARFLGMMVVIGHPAGNKNGQSRDASRRVHNGDCGQALACPWTGALAEGMGAPTKPAKIASIEVRGGGRDKHTLRAWRSSAGRVLEELVLLAIWTRPGGEKGTGGPFGIATPSAWHTRLSQDLVLEGADIHVLPYRRTPGLHPSPRPRQRTLTWGDATWARRSCA